VPTLHIHRSTRAEDLVESLARVLDYPLGDPMQRDCVVVHSSGLERWLQMRLAQRHGVCANVWFCHPHELVGAALAAVLGDDSDTSAWTADRIGWAVLASLPELAGEPALQPVRDFIAAGEGIDDGRREVEVAARIGALFERYATYRPNLARAWSDGADDGWEAPLWRAASARVDGFNVADLASLLGDELAGTPDLSSLPARICLFSVATLPPLQLELLARLARHREVHLFVLAPSVAWTDRLAPLAAELRGAEVMPAPGDLPDLDAHPLLESMGTIARDFQLAILRTDHDVVDVPSSDPEPATLLGHLQRDVARGVLPTTPPALDLPDGSVQVHACHGTFRQVEVLRDVLLQLLDDLPGLEHRDILVMVPDIETWAPLIRSVFDDGGTWARRDDHPGGLPRIPYTIADQGAATSNPAADVLLALLRLAGRRFKTSEVLDLLGMEPVRHRFGVAPEDMATVRGWIHASGIRWGADAAHRSELGQPDTDLYTWRHGLDRLLIGQAVADPDALVLDVAPYGGIEGNDSRALLEGLVDFGEKVIEHVRGLDDVRPLAQWRDLLLRLVEDFVDLPSDRRWQVDQVVDGLAEMTSHAADAGFDRPLDRGAIESLLQGRFSVSEPGAGFLSGAVTFCQLVPMRSIPFRVVCLVGMDDGAFPRGGTGLAFDRIDAQPRAGDRSTREDDRALFLEAVLSARDALVITCTGRRVRDDRACPPAVPVAELLDVLDATATCRDGRRVSQAVRIDHRLQAYSPEYFSAASRFGPEPFGHDRRQRAAAEAWRKGRSAPEPPPGPLVSGPIGPLPDLEADGGVVQLDELCRFWSDPLAWFCNSVLGLWSPDEETTVEDREPLDAPRYLQAWTVRDRLLRWGLEGLSLDRPGPAWDRLRQAADLPLGTLGEAAYDEIAGEAAGIAQATLGRQAGPEAPGIAIDLDLGGVRLVGRVGQLYPGGRVEHRAGSVGDKHLLQAWIRHLAASADGWAGSTHLVGRNGASALAPVEAVPAREALSFLARAWHVGQVVPLLFFPRQSLTWASDDEPDPAGVWPPGRYDCPWRERVLGAANPFEPDFADESELVPEPGLAAPVLAERVWGPFLDSQEADR